MKLGVLYRFFARDLIQTRIAAVLVATWSVLLIATLAANLVVHRSEEARRSRQADAMTTTYERLPNYNFLFQNFYVVQRPAARHYPIVNGVEYGAPGYIDFRPRESPMFYHGDDVDPVARLFRPLDVPFIVGVIGFLIALLLGHDSVNGEVERGNARFMSLFGVKLWHIYVAKSLVLMTLLCGSFAVAYAIGLIPYVLSDAPSMARLVLLGAAGVVYLIYATVCMCTISALCRRRATGFLVGVAVFLVTTYVTPNTAVYVARLLSPDSEVAVEEAQAFARDYHRRFLDPLSHEARMAMATVKPDLKSIRESMVKHGVPARGAKFITDNMNATMEINAAALKQMHEKNHLVLQLGMPASPYLSMIHTMSSIAGTGIDDDLRLTGLVQQKMAPDYRDYWIQKTRLGVDPNIPIEKWIFAKSLDPAVQPGKRITLAGIEPPRYPEASLRTILPDLIEAALVPIIYALVLWFVGIMVARRRGRTEP